MEKNSIKEYAGELEEAIHTGAKNKITEIRYEIQNKGIERNVLELLSDADRGLLKYILEMTKGDKSEGTRTTEMPREVTINSKGER